MGDKAKALECKAKGNAAFQGGLFQEAVDHFSEAILNDPSDHVLFSNRSGAYASLHNYEAALKDAEECVRLNPQWAKGYSRRGLAEFNLGNVHQAEVTYRAGLKIDPTNEGLKSALKNLEDSQESMMDMQAMMAASMAVRSNPKLKGYADADPDYIKRLTELLKSIQKNPANIKLAAQQPDQRLREGLMAVLNVPGQDEEEVKVRETKKPETPKESEKKPHEIEADEWKEKGNKLYKAKEFEEALQAYDKAISLNPLDVTYMNNKAAVYLEMKRYDDCLAQCKSALEKKSTLRLDFKTTAKLMNRMAACYTRMKDYDKAIEMYQKSLLEDNDRHIRVALKDLERIREKNAAEAYLNVDLAEEHRLKGNDFFKCGDYPNAKIEYDEAIRRNPSDPKLYSNRAAALQKLLEAPSAIRDCEKALELDPKFVKAWSRKGNLHFMMKEYNKALQAFDKGLAIEPESQECNEGKMKVIMKIQETSRSSEVDEEQYRHALADPEVQEILKDPQFQLILGKISENPASLAEYMNDKKIASGIQKLMAAGILRVG